MSFENKINEAISNDEFFFLQKYFNINYLIKERVQTQAQIVKNHPIKNTIQMKAKIRALKTKRKVQNMKMTINQVHQKVPKKNQLKIPLKNSLKKTITRKEAIRVRNTSNLKQKKMMQSSLRNLKRRKNSKQNIKKKKNHWKENFLE